MSAEAVVVAAVAVATPLLAARAIARETSGHFLAWLMGLGAVAFLPLTVALVLGEALAPYIFLGAIAAAALAIAVVDYAARIIPDILVVALAAIALVAPFRPTLVDQAFGALVLGLLFMGVRSVFFALRRREGLGLGDVKLAVVIGAMLGAERALAASGYAAAITGICVLIGAQGSAKTNGKTAALGVEAPLGVGLSGALVVTCALVVMGW